jgi:hypothetical protein
VKEVKLTLLSYFFFFIIGLVLGIGLTLYFTGNPEGFSILLALLGTATLTGCIGFGVWVGFIFTQHGANLTNNATNQNDNWDVQKTKVISEAIKLGTSLNANPKVIQVDQAPAVSVNHWLPEVTKFGE